MPESWFGHFYTANKKSITQSADEVFLEGGAPYECVKTLGPCDERCADFLSPPLTIFSVILYKCGRFITKVEEV